MSFHLKLVSGSAEAQVKFERLLQICATESGVQQKVGTKFLLSSKALYWK